MLSEILSGVGKQVIPGGECTSKLAYIAHDLGLLEAMNITDGCFSLALHKNVDNPQQLNRGT
jgi:hypothetical protein